ncbi:minor head protein [Burkholderia phage Maja]|uniref:Minor head protein n=1 Tax=Burkholderia phage Maja TaxID=2767571 RepID=A0A7S6U3M1_9CAUD|nr:minor head protein [Burkholderia phage Maja]
MAFKASKKRQRRAPEPFGRGSPIIPNAGIEAWYRREMNGVVRAMLEDYRTKIREAIEHPEVERFYGDAAAKTVFIRVLERLNKYWQETFEGFAAKCAPEFVSKTEQSVTTSTLASLSVAGVNEPRATYNEAVSNTLGAAIDFNHTLITGIQKETHEKIYESVMLSLTSPNPEQQGTSGIENAIREAGITAKNRVDLIARDQTSKLYSSLSDDRMRENGCEEFEWLHSSAGKTQRESHVHLDGRIFRLDDPRLWEVGGELNLKKSDVGPPGWAINCRCRKLPVFR